ncbi:uncharacterized protein BDV17DRAFT_277968 [Aspergillus undulatus]|uniref:uncharacterized protein n=1 Tax=Aspergillus undulatus TaxID=1810928 RepID=UPI003CCE0DBA
MQRSRNLTMRQVMALADREWMPFAGNIRLISSGVKYRSLFLFIAMALNLLGLIIAPLQMIFLSTNMIKTPIGAQSINSLLDLAITGPRYEYSYPESDNNLITAMARSVLKTATLDEAQAQLWMGAGASCDPLSDNTPVYNWSATISEKRACSAIGPTFGTMDQLPDPFLAELPSGFNTGLIRQFAPRINSTARYESVTAEEFPADCQSIENGLFVEYANTTGPSNYPQTWGIQVCMPSNATQSPWRATRDRQEFSEVMYLNITIDGYQAGFYGKYGNAIYRVTLHTTAGYFELPNYMNGGLAGPLLDKDPSELCDSNCESQGYRDGAIGYSNHYERRQLQLSDPSDALDPINNKGPLLTIALALFGEGSFIASRARNPAAYATTVLRDNPTDAEYRMSVACIDTVPLGWLFSKYPTRGLNRCISNGDGGEEGWDVRNQIAVWLGNFITNEDPADMQSTFTAAAFLANKVWMQHNAGSTSNLKVTYDRGIDTKVPVISLAGIIVVSVLLATHVFSLLALGIYSRWSPRWTSTLDSFAMMRMGTDILPQLPMLLALGSHRLDVFDQAPGYVGDAAEGETTGRLGVGASAHLKEGKNYLSFHEVPNVYDP